MRWVVACVIGEAIGIAVVSLGYSMGDRLYPQFAPALVLAAGAVEGLALGGAQAIAGRRFGIKSGRWIAVTVLAALVGYGLSVLGQSAFTGGTIDAASRADEPPFYLIAAAGAGLGAFMGALFGAAQSLVLPAHKSKRGWVLRNIVGWTAAMAFIMLAASFAGSDWPFWRVALLGCASGAAAGLSLGLATRGAFLKT